MDTMRINIYVHFFTHIIHTSLAVLESGRFRLNFVYFLLCLVRSIQSNTFNVMVGF
jgi:hypothetical protein